MNPNPSRTPGLVARTRRRTGLAMRIREYIRAHPGCDSPTIAAALGEPCKPVAHRCSQMAKHGVLDVERQRRTSSRSATRRYTLAREVIQVVGLSPEEVKARRRERQRDWERMNRNHKRREISAKQRADRKARGCVQRAVIAEACAVKADIAEPKTDRRETVAEWQMRTGNRPEVLRGFVHQPDLRRRGQMHYRQGAAP